MLPVRSRLRRASEIREVGRSGVRRSRIGLSVAVLVGPDDRSPRATVVVNKKVGGAVVRNRLRRQVRHGLIRIWDEIPPGAQIVVRAQAAARELDPADLDEHLVGAVRSATASRRAVR